MIRSRLFSFVKCLNIRQFSVSRELQNSSSSTQDPDPFGLDDSTHELPSVVQGLYSSVAPVLVNDVTSSEKNAEDYKRWLDEANIKRRNERITSETELVHNAPFGTIRFDRDNVACEEEDSLPHSQMTDLLNSSSTVAQNTNSTTSRKSRISSNKQSAQNNSETEATKATLVEAGQQSGTKNEEPIAVIPAAYQLDSLNDLTRGELWDLLRKQVVFQNDFILAINKPIGLPMHSPSKECRHTVLDFMEELTTFAKSSEILYPVHRLDKDTTGVLLFAKTEQAAAIIKEKFALRRIMKKYLVITKNCPSMRSGTIDIPIAEGKVGGTEIYRSVLKPDLRKYKVATSQAGAKAAITHFKIINSTRDCAFMEINPETGIKHQIRIHLGMGLGCPILGDHKYSHRDKLAPQRLTTDLLQRLNVRQSKVRHLPLHLHCSSVEFTMPESFTKNPEPIFVHSRPPKHFMHTLRRLGFK